MANKYLELKEKQQAEVNEFPLAFAFSDKQFEEGMAKLGLTKDDTDKVYSLQGTGGFYRRTDAKALHDMFDRHEKEMQEAIDADLTGEGFIYDMFYYELANHEYSYTREVGPTLDALGLTWEEVQADEKLKTALRNARYKQTETE